MHSGGIFNEHLSCDRDGQQLTGAGDHLGSGHAAALGRCGGSAGPGQFQDVGFRHLALRPAESGGGAMDSHSLNGRRSDRPAKGARIDV